MAISNGRSDNHQSAELNPPRKYDEDVPGSAIQVALDVSAGTCVSAVMRLDRRVG